MDLGFDAFIYRAASAAVICTCFVTSCSIKSTSHSKVSWWEYWQEIRDECTPLRPCVTTGSPQSSRSILTSFFWLTKCDTSWHRQSLTRRAPLQLHRADGWMDGWIDILRVLFPSNKWMQIHLSYIILVKAQHISWTYKRVEKEFFGRDLALYK